MVVAVSAEDWIFAIGTAGQLLWLVAVVMLIRWQLAVRDSIRKPPVGPKREPYKWPREHGFTPPKPTVPEADRPKPPRRIVVPFLVGAAVWVTTLAIRIGWF